ncbi:MAG: glycosyltransferase family 2 protein [Luteolibacter sp.]|nr:glycosyltransferase family 2 protein [Luteolibacter sp.]
MPVFNEQASVPTVIDEWFSVLDREVGNFTLLAINDGSTDDTGAILQSMASELGTRLQIINRPNRGHGQSCIEGYRIAVEQNIPFLLQIDSDGQSDPRYFARFWELRHQFDVTYGKRTRQDGFRRILASTVLRSLLRLLAGVDCVDANVPYRLMNASACAEGIHRVPSDVFLANIALAVILRKNPAIRHGQVPIGFPPRHGGEPSVPFLKFAAKGIELFSQLKKAGITL